MAAIAAAMFCSCVGGGRGGPPGKPMGGCGKPNVGGGGGRLACGIDGSELGGIGSCGAEKQNAYMYIHKVDAVLIHRMKVGNLFAPSSLNLASTTMQ